MSLPSLTYFDPKNIEVFPPFRQEMRLLKDSEYFHDIERKTQIVCHYTASSTAASAYDWWNTDPQKVGTAFIVDHDGTQIQTFKDVRNWAWHLGVGRLFGEAADRQSIGIEIVNVGPLTTYVKPDGTGATDLYWWAQKAGRELPYGRIGDAHVTQCNPVWRGHRWHAAYTMAQIWSVIDLLDRLTREFNIPREFLPEKQLMEAQPYTAKAFKGIVGHHNYLAEKSDPGPWFPWDFVKSQLASHP